LIAVRTSSKYLGLLLCGLLASAAARCETGAPAHEKNPLFYFKFTNELGQAVSLSDFQGQALAVTFFFTRCPMPNFCPRLSKNFEEASRALAADKAAATNWHFLSVTFDPEFDTPPVLRAYGERYAYDARHWSFLTGPPAQVSELARLSGVKAEPEGGLINHNFRTLIIDATGKLQMMFPVGGNLSDAIVGEIRKAAVASRSSIPPEPAVALAKPQLKASSDKPGAVGP
jgi:cytochrome oxidase Cu insertion factor (SCO1/SenC/PrrC family)